MLARKILALGDTGDSSHWGTDDADYINLYLTDTDQVASDGLDAKINTLTTFRHLKFRYRSADATANYYILNASNIAANRNIILPALTGDDTFTFNAASQTLTNKTLTAPVIATIVNTGTLTLPTSTDTLVGRATADTLTNKTLTTPTIGTPVFSSYDDFTRISAPANPGANFGRMYVKQIDSNNDGLFVLVKKNGAYVEVQLS